MKWILGYLNQYDYVVYKTDASQSIEQLPLDGFIGLVRKYIKNSYAEFLENLNRYFTILIDIENCVWEVYRKKFDEPPFEKLYELNNKDRNMNTTQLYKNYINKIFDNKYDRPDKNQSRTRNNIRSLIYRNK